MATEVEDTLVPSHTSGSGVYGVDSTLIEGDKASKPPVHDAKEEILRLPVKDFKLRWGKNTNWKYIVILRAGHRKVAIHPLRNQHSLLGREKKHSYVVQSAINDCSIDYIGF